MSFQQGLSGLNAAARNLDVIGNNVANSNTVGAKSARAEFADVYATSLSGAGGSFNGIGVTVSRVTQEFAQGDIVSSSGALDMAINGAGFFRMSDSGEITYTRNGQFTLDKDGYIVNAQGSKLTGFMADANGQVNAGTPAELRLQTGDVAPRATSAARATVNLDARTVAPTTAFSLTDATSYNGATPIPVFDAQGSEHTIVLYFRKVADNDWEIHASADGGQIGTGPIGSIQFGPDGRPTATSSTSFTASVPLPASMGGSLSVPIDLATISQYGSPFSVTDMAQDGYAAGRLAGFTIGGDGTLLARYTNGQTLAQGRVALSNFTNPQGLMSIGGNQWIETAESGIPMTGSPGAGTLGVIQASALEQSNVDLTAQLVNMITAQRVYQANAQTIRTQDQIMQTIVNLR
ncbi:MAG: flagellar hook protein FlgE [Lautropia sp. SCN 70-15]|jgi:flagellar hook protein FlgE|nr:MAG: flagellar hook protein FlgE [Lautropia sp. SCN 70-15]